MKKNSRLPKAIIWILVFSIAILMALFLIIYTPVDFLRYCFSNRRAEMKRLYGKRAKYTWIVTLTDHYRMYELISKNNLPIEFYPKNQNPSTHGYFYYDHTLFLPDVVPHFNSEANHWYIGNEEDESDFHAFVEAEKEAFLECVDYDENIKCEKIVFLVKEHEVYDEEKDLVEKADFILTYNKKNFKEKISKFLSK